MIPNGSLTRTRSGGGGAKGVMHSGIPKLPARRFELLGSTPLQKSGSGGRESHHIVSAFPSITVITDSITMSEMYFSKMLVLRRILIFYQTRKKGRGLLAL